MFILRRSMATVASNTGKLVKSSWSLEEIKNIYNRPLTELLYQAATVHRQNHDPSKVQLCTLMNIKTGGCSEDCKYCAQSSRYSTDVEASKLVTVESVIEAAKEAKENGSTRFCMGAAWRDMKGRKSNLKRIGQMVQEVNALGLESCVTLGMIDQEQLKSLKDSGLTAYNHNIDTSKEHYPEVITTRSFEDRLGTIDNVAQSGISVCTGGILGLGETPADHVSFLHTLATMSPHPESVPINRLVQIKGTPLMGKAKEIQLDELVRVISTARIVMPTSIIRLAAGRYNMKEADQMLCFQAGVNSIFTGKKMLTTMCNGWDEDKALLKKWGYQVMDPQPNITKARETTTTTTTTTSSSSLKPESAQATVSA